ncbi:MAG: winged helix-turn-helix domain-containing protein [Planctomycetota bacterium]
MDEDAFQAVHLCQMLGSTTRYRILKLLAEQKMTPGELSRQLGKSSSVISVQLGKLRTAGLVRFKREATGLFYWPKPAGLGGLIDRIERYASKAL